MKKPDIADALEKVMNRRPSIVGIGIISSEKDYNNIQWQIGISPAPDLMAIFGEPEDKPPWEDVKKAMDELEAEYATFNYQRNRKPEYPAIEDQLDLLYHEGIEGWKKIIKDVKDKYPKPEAPSE